MSQGDDANTAMYLMEGQLDVLLFSNNNKIHRLGQVYPGEVFGEQGLFVCNATRNAQVSARTDGLCLQLDRSFMHQETQNAAVVIMEKLILATLARRIRSANLNLQKLNTITTTPVAPKKSSLFSQLQHWIGKNNESRSFSTNRARSFAKTQC
jgi:CRP-like cAMP-binding protein